MFIDLFCVLLAGVSFYLGYSKGILKSIFAILSILVGILATLKLSHIFIALVENTLRLDPRMNVIIGFVLTFLLFMIAIRMIGQGLEKILETAHINFINQLAGGIASAFITLLIYSSFIWFLNQVRLIKPETKQASFTYAYLETFPSKSRWVWEKCKPFFSEFWNKTQEAIRKSDQQATDPANSPAGPN